MTQSQQQRKVIIALKEAGVGAGAGGDNRDGAVSAAVRQIVGYFKSDALSKGARVELRRMDVHHRIESSFWKVLFTCVAPHLRQTEDEELRWALIIKCLAMLNPEQINGMPFGAALFHCEVSPDRLNSLLRSSAEGLETRIQSSLQRIGNKGLHVNCNTVAQLIYFDGLDDDLRDRVRIDIARDYYRAQASVDSANMARLRGINGGASDAGDADAHAGSLPAA